MCLTMPKFEIYMLQHLHWWFTDLYGHLKSMSHFSRQIVSPQRQHLRLVCSMLIYLQVENERVLSLTFQYGCHCLTSFWARVFVTWPSHLRLFAQHITSHRHVLDIALINSHKHIKPTWNMQGNSWACVMWWAWCVIQLKWPAPLWLL